jgi:hypothetical protein
MLNWKSNRCPPSLNQETSRKWSLVASHELPILQFVWAGHLYVDLVLGNLTQMSWRSWWRRRGKKMWMKKDEALFWGGGHFYGGIVLVTVFWGVSLRGSLDGSVALLQATHSSFIMCRVLTRLRWTGSDWDWRQVQLWKNALVALFKKWFHWITLHTSIGTTKKCQFMHLGHNVGIPAGSRLIRSIGNLTFFLRNFLGIRWKTMDLAAK